MKNAPPHTPRHPLMDNLWHVLQDYRARKSFGSRRTGEARRRCLELIAQIKGRT